MSNDIASIYPYLASVGITSEELALCCIKKGVVKKLDSLQNVTVEVDSVEYENVPVWIHTDAGARYAAVKGVEKANPSDYFKDAALMFPFPGGVSVFQRGNWSGTSTPTVFVLMKNDEKVLGVVGIVGSATQQFPNSTEPFRTYRPYIYMEARWESFMLGNEIKHKRYYLYDVLNQKVAEIPTYGEGPNFVPGLPFVPVDGILYDPESPYNTDLDRFLYDAYKANAVVNGTAGDPQGRPYDHYWIGYVGNTTQCYSEDGTYIQPGAEFFYSEPWPRVVSVDVLCNHPSVSEDYGYSVQTQDSCLEGDYVGYFPAYVHTGTYSPIVSDIVETPAYTMGGIFAGQTEFRTDFIVKVILDYTINHIFKLTSGSCANGQTFYITNTFNNPSLIAYASVTIGDTTFTSDFSLKHFAKYQYHGANISSHHWEGETLYNLNETTQTNIYERALIYDVRVLTPQNFLCNFRGYSMFQSGLQVRDTTDYQVFSDTYTAADLMTIEDYNNIKIVEGTLFAEDSYVQEVSGFYMFAATAIRNLLLDMINNPDPNADDLSRGAWKGIDVIQLCFVPFDFDIALLEET